MPDRYKGNDEGGYGNPPVSTQFKKGGKGGPGRPKGSSSINASLRKVFGGNMDLKMNGQHVTLPVTEAIAKRAAALGVLGNERANAAAIKLAEHFGPREQEITSKLDMSRLDEHDFREFVRLLSIIEGKPMPKSMLPLTDRPDVMSDYWLSNHMDGVQYKHFRHPRVAPELITVGRGAYLSAAQPRRKGSYGDMSPPQEISDEN